jgi:hypothetical protein
MRQTTSKTIHNGVLQLCPKINPAEKPLIVPVKSHPSALDKDCFPNVQKQIADHGGSLLHGWRILELPGFFIEGEFHGVWVAPDGTLLDVSPADGDEIVFLPDPTLIFDEKSFNRRDNIRLALSDHPTVHAFLAHCERIFQYEERHTLPNDRRRFAVDADEYEALQRRKLQLQAEMVSVKPGRNDPCRCGSGLKFKKCCGK